MKQLDPLLDMSAPTVSGRTVRENLAGVTVRNPEVIRPLDRPFSRKPAIVLLRGSLAPESAIVKLPIAEEKRKTKFTGTAIVYENGPDAISGIERGEVKPGHVLVVRGMGPKGGPGMAGPASRVVFSLYSADLENDVAFVSDGQLSGLCNKGLTVAEVSPEAAVGGPLSLVEAERIARSPVPATAVSLERGQARYEVFCVVCHGPEGSGGGAPEGPH